MRPTILQALLIVALNVSGVAKHAREIEDMCVTYDTVSDRAPDVLCFTETYGVERGNVGLCRLPEGSQL